MDLSIIINNYKTKEKTLRCLESIQKSETNNLNYEIIVIDNNSQDQSLEFIQKNFQTQQKKISFLQNKKNKGMGAGNNFGIKKAQGQYLFILNPDVILEKQTIKKLYLTLKQNKEIGLIAPKLLNPDQSFQHSCFRWPSFFIPLYRRTFLAKLNQKKLNHYLYNNFNHNQEKEVNWIMGSCFMLKKNIFPEQEKTFDERFFMYLEDTDLCYRIFQSGYKVIFYPQARVIHDHDRASAKELWFLAPFTNKLAREHIKSWLKYFWKWKIKY